MASKGSVDPVIFGETGTVFRDALKKRLDASADELGIPDWREKEWYMHPGFTARYGVELEFLSTKDRYFLGTSINSCMAEQQDPFWRKNFEILHPTAEQREQFRHGISGPRSITDTDEMNEWSSSMLEATPDHGSTTFRGIISQENRGKSGFKIEHDGTVKEDFQMDAILYGGANHEYHMETIPARSFKVNYKSTKQDVIPWLVNSRYVTNDDSASADAIPIIPSNELVTGILTNEPIEYPYVYHNNGTYEKSYYPYGYMVLDNMIQHLQSHHNTVIIQQMGLHVHLSEYPRVEGNSRHIKLGNFIKLFYLFEPLIFACHPSYRNRSEFCQPMQRVFSLNEIVKKTPKQLYDAMTDYKKTWISHRVRDMDKRYVALNLTNCREDGSGTVEVRLGHSTFDSHFINHYIHMLQNLFELSFAVSTEKINQLLTIAHRCKAYPQYTYNTELYEAEYEPCSFFSNTNKLERTSIIHKLMRMYYYITGAKDNLIALRQYINYYNASTANLYCFDWLHPIDYSVDDTFDAAIMKQDSVTWNPNRLSYHPRNADNIVRTYATNPNHRLQDCRPVLINTYKEINYFMTKMQLENALATESSNQHIIANKLARLNDMGVLFVNHKTQTEMIVSKIQAKHAGGHRANTRTRRRTRKRTHTRKGGRTKMHTNLNNHSPTAKASVTSYVPMKSMTFTTPHETTQQRSDRLYELTYRVNRGAVPIVLDPTRGACYADWLGNRQPDETLNAIFKALLDRKIITRAILDLLLRKRYVDLYVYRVRTPLHVRKLKEELAPFGLDEAKIDEIRAVYLEYSNPPNKRH